MEGYILLADGTRLDGELVGADKTVIGRLVANTAVVGFQEMVTDPTYADRILAFTYPEVGNVGATAAFSESGSVQVTGLAVKVLSEYRSHYRSEESFLSLLERDGVPCLVGVDTRWLALHARENGEMPAAIASSATDAGELAEALKGRDRAPFAPTATPSVGGGNGGPTVAVLTLGIRRSDLQQLAACCMPVVFPHDAQPEAIMRCGPDGLFVTDGPGGVKPPAAVVETIKSLLGRLPMLACGLGHGALGVALGCEVSFLKRGHHGANYAVRNLQDGTMDVSHQRHSVLVDRDSAEQCGAALVTWENVNDGTVEGIGSSDGSAAGIQFMLPAPQAGAVNEHIKGFVDRLSRGGS